MLFSHVTTVHAQRAVMHHPRHGVIMGIMYKLAVPSTGVGKSTVCLEAKYTHPHPHHVPTHIHTHVCIDHTTARAPVQNPVTDKLWQV